MPFAFLHRSSIRRMHGLFALFNTLLVTVLCLVIIIYSFQLESTSLLQESRQPYTEVCRYYAQKSEQLWRLYQPVLSDASLTNAFSALIQESKNSLSPAPSTLMRLCDALKKMQMMDSDIAGFILHPYDETQIDYYFDCTSSRLQKLEDSSPFRAYLPDDSISRVITPSFQITSAESGSFLVYGISGLFPDASQRDGGLIVLYRTDALHMCHAAQSDKIASDMLLLTSDGSVIFDSSNTRYGQTITLEETKSDTLLTLEDTRYYAHIESGDRSRYTSICLTLASDVLHLGHCNTPLILLLCLLINLVNIFFHLYTGRLTAGRVNTLLSGIDRIGHNELDFRFPDNDSHDEYGQIAQCINRMAEMMQANIEQSYLYSIREKTAEMGELQAKFNPHFLYNTLEVIRSHLQQHGDNDTADMIVLMSRVFRSAINNSHFTTLRSECLFINSYLDIYRWRYQNSFDVIYDMDTDLLDCGIIRNLLQPVIENYFIHGFSTASDHNQLIISGQADGSKYILLCVEDNGLGIAPERLSKLSENLSACCNEATASDSYGLQNLNDRIRLFYGPDCGVTVESIPQKKTVITLRILRLSPTEHENWIRTH